MIEPLFGRFRLNERTQKRKKVSTRKKTAVAGDSTAGIKTRSKAGCLSCRKRKIKCFGTQQPCHNCVKSSYECVWPEEKTPLPHQNQFTLTRRTYNLSPKEDDRIVFESKEDELFRKVLIEINSSVISEINQSDETTLLNAAFIKGFMTDVTPQLAHVKLQPGSAFIPLGGNNPILQNLFHSCGASFLYTKTKNEKMKLLSQLKFDKSAEALMQKVADGKIFGEETWMPVYFLLTYLKLKFVYEGQRIHTLSMLAVVEAIKFWITQKHSLGDSFIPTSSASTETLEVASLDPDEATFAELINSFRVYTSNRLLCYDDSDAESFVKILPSERTILESFVYNYANLIFRCDRSLKSELTSPFIIFDSLRPYLTVPIYQCAVPWMNHPIVGAAFPLIEFQAKLCWLGLSDRALRKEEKQIVQEIKNSVNDFIRPSLPPSILSEEPQNIQNKLLESCFAAEILSKALYIYATRLLYPDLPLEVELVQNSVDAAYAAFNQISPQSQVHVMLLFSIVVIGCSSVKTDHKEYMTHKLENLQEVFKVHSLTTIAPVFEAAWHTNEYGMSRGWNVLFDPDCIASAVF